MATIPVHYVNPRGDVTGAANDRWWAGDDPAKDIAAIVHRLEQDQSDLNDQRLVYGRLYANQPLQSLYGLGILRTPGASSIAGSRVTFNVCQSAVDTASAKIAKNKPRVLFLTSGGDWSMQERAKGLTKYTDGLFYSTGLYEIGQQVFVDACVFGTGLAKIYHEDGAVKAERVLECEVFLNEAEAINGKPRTMYQRQYIHREVAAAKYGANDDECIRILAVPGVDLLGGESTNSPMIPAYEAWHLPSKKGAKDGKHCLTIGDVTVWSRPYTKDYFPFVKLVWNPRLVGWRGQGLIDQLVGIQLEINRLLKTIQAAQHLMAVPRFLVERGSKIVKAHLNNEVGAIVEYTGTPPQIQLGQAVPPELYAHLEKLYQKAYEITGISMLSATAQKPAGLNAAVAMREYHDIESERFVIVGQRYESWFIEAARIMIDISRDLYKDNKALQIKAPGTKVIEDIKWSQVNMEEDAFELRAFPTSILPTTPAGRLQKIQELLEGQLIDRDTAMGLLDFPDLEGAMSLQLAGQADAKKSVERILDGKYETPEPYMNLQLAIKLAQSAYLKA
ncbi:MAG: hypothetical protein M3R04_05440, partial [bacterium]|nr:hypothetical protein [bacterium]